MTVKILVGDALSQLAALPDESVHCCVSSPPYWALRSYGGDPGMIGLEPTFDEHLENLLAVFREVRRVLRKDGTLWLNYGDAYAGGGRGKGSGKQTTNVGSNLPPFRPDGFKPKDLMMMPARVAMALQADGWWLRSEIVWCLSGGTWLYAETQKGVGVHMLRDLVRLDPATVRLWDGQKWTRVRGWSETPKPDSAIEIVLRSGERIGCTPRHQWPTERGLLRADELKVGDCLKSTPLPVGNTPSPGWLTVDALWFAGLYLAEGSMSGDTIQIAGHVKETARWERVQEVCEHFGASPRLYVDGNSQSIHIDRSAALRAVLDVTLAGRTAKDKRLASGVWNWGNASLKSIIQGYLDGDGGKDGNRVRLGFTRNYGLERDLRCAAARLDATLTLRPAFAQMGEKTFPAFRGEWRWDRSGHHNEKARTEIVEIRRSRARRFYDVGVEEHPHVFALASGVLTHNSKPNPMPESVTDRPTSAHEKVFLFSKAVRYFYDHVAVRTPLKPETRARDSRADMYENEVPPGASKHSGIRKRRSDKQRGHSRRHAGFNDRWDAMSNAEQQAAGANLRNVWKVATKPFKGAHFATFPPEIVEPCVKAGTSEKGACANCGAPWTRDVVTPKAPRVPATGKTKDDPRLRMKTGQALQDWRDANPPRTVGWRPSCACDADVVPAACLDPFAGAGTVGLVADRLGRDAILIEINPEYAEMARGRIVEDAGGKADREILAVLGRERGRVEVSISEPMSAVL